MALDLGVTPTGQVEIQVGDRRRRFDNLVLDAGWLSLLNRMNDVDGAMVPTWLHFGTGDSDPEPGDIGLEQRSTGTAKAETSREYRGLVDAGNLTAYSEVVVRFDYAAGELTGEWAELGLSYDEGYGEPYNRALVRDENGEPTSLIVMSYQPVTVYARLRLYLTEWGQTVDLSDSIDGLTGKLSMEGNIASATQGLWLKGFPTFSAEMGGVTSKAEGFDVTVPTVKQYFAVAPPGAWSASRILFQGRDDVPMLRLDFDPELAKPDGLTLYLRVRVTIVRG